MTGVEKIADMVRQENADFLWINCNVADIIVLEREILLWIGAV